MIRKRMASVVKPITILIADDRQVFNDGLHSLLRSVGSRYQVVDQVYTGTGILPAIQNVHPDLVLLDINLPNRNGLNRAREVVQAFPLVRVIIISMYSYQTFVDELKAIGVAGYLLKSASQQELFTCLQNVVDGIPYFDPKSGSKAGTLHPEDDLLKRFKLSPRELEIIALLKRGFDTPEIAKRLFLLTETVKIHRKNIYYKLAVNNLAELIQFADEQGL